MTPDIKGSWWGPVTNASSALSISDLLNPRYAYVAWDKALSANGLVATWPEYDKSALDASQTNTSLQPFAKTENELEPYIDFGTTGKYLSLPGSINSLFSNRAFSIHTRVKFTSFPQYGSNRFSIFSTGSSGSVNNLDLGLPTNRIQFACHNGSNIYHTKTLTADQWVDITVSFSTTKAVSLYVMGQKETLTFASMPSISTASVPAIGAVLFIGPYYLNAKINRILFFDRALNDDEEAQLRVLPMQ